MFFVKSFIVYATKGLDVGREEVSEMCFTKVGEIENQVGDCDGICLGVGFGEVIEKVKNVKFNECGTVFRGFGAFSGDFNGGRADD